VGFESVNAAVKESVARERLAFIFLELDRAALQVSPY